MRFRKKKERSIRYRAPFPSPFPPPSSHIHSFMASQYSTTPIFQSLPFINLYGLKLPSSSFYPERNFFPSSSVMEGGGGKKDQIFTISPPPPPSLSFPPSLLHLAALFFTCKRRLFLQKFYSSYSGAFFTSNFRFPYFSKKLYCVVGKKERGMAIDSIFNPINHYFFAISLHMSLTFLSYWKPKRFLIS